MPVVEVNSSLFPDRAAGEAGADTLYTHGRVYVASGTVSNAADDSNTSKYRLCDLPWDALLHPDTQFDVENDGFAAIRIGTEDDVDALVSQTQATENIITPVAFGDANFLLPLWQVLGLAEMPLGVCTLYKHAVADAAGAGSMPFRVVWIHR